MSHEINQLGTKYALFYCPVALYKVFFFIFRSCTSRKLSETF